MFISASIFLCIYRLFFFRMAAVCIAFVLPKVLVEHACVIQNLSERWFRNAVAYFNQSLEHLCIFLLVHH